MAAIAARRRSRSRSTWSPRSPATARRYGLPISGIGGITTWRDAAEFMALGCRQCAGLHRRDGLWLQDRRGDDFGAVQLDGREGLRDARRFHRPGRAATSPTGSTSTSNYITKARIDQDLCIKCGRCHIACEDTSHQAITQGEERRSPLRGDGQRVRRLQPLRQCLPGRGLHHHGSSCRPARSTSAPAASSPATTPTGPRIRTTRCAKSRWVTPGSSSRRSRPARAGLPTAGC